MASRRAPVGDRCRTGRSRPGGLGIPLFFCLLCGYYILRPVRDEMAIEGGVEHLPWMMTSTFVTPLFG
ncbi:MAG: hypothetical protein L0Z46_08345 [Nitrospiraceae bacterium]|nr:hypothetical protein [Nitrospiraceae bacterium]